MQNYQNFKVDLSNCDVEPIHIIGRIQPHGFLLVLNKNTLEIEQVSENICDFLPSSPADLVGKKLDVIASHEEYALLEKQLRLNSEVRISVELIQLQGQLFFGFLHESQGSLVLEGESYGLLAEGQQMLDLTNRYTRFLEKLDQQDSLVEQAQLTTEFVQQAIGYDQVMLYRFDEDWHGEVIAETIKAGHHSYLHHHFPATDIPAQARALLLQKPIRQIADVNASAVKITPYLNPVTGQPSNIILSEFRNPSEIHLEYLQNMGVQATLSISIIVNGKLWGIIACQHKTPKIINYWRRQLCLNVAHAFSNGILAHQEQRDLQHLDELRQQEEQLMRHFMHCENLHEELDRQLPAILRLTEATSVALLFDGKCFTYGNAPSTKLLNKLADWLSENVDSSTFFTRELSKIFPEAETATSEASGLLALEISKLNKEYLLYFKPEMSETRVWAGKPDKETESISQFIHPRKSFAKWVQVIKGKSLAWSLNEIEVAQTMVKDVITITLRNQKQHLQELNEKLSLSTELLQLKNRRLEDFAQIISHNLRSPLANMEGLVNLYLYQPSLETGSEVMQMMERVIQNMGATLDDLNLILESELRRQTEFQEVYLPDILERELQNQHAIILESGAQVELDLSVTHIKAPKVYLESIIHNLLSNALKYRSAERQPIIQVKTWEEHDYTCISVIDNGQGIDLNRHGHKVFNLYKTFHGNSDAKGLGLYITKMQAEALGGRVSVESTPNVGSVFKVCLKV